MEERAQPPPSVHSSAATSATNSGVTVAVNASAPSVSRCSRRKSRRLERTAGVRGPVVSGSVARTRHPPARPGTGGELAADGSRTLPHPRDPAPGSQARSGRLCRGTWRVVVHGEVQCPLIAPYVDPDGGAGRVPQRVGEGFPDDAEDRLGGRPGQIVGHPGGDRPAQPAETGDQFLDRPAHRRRPGAEFRATRTDHAVSNTCRGHNTRNTYEVGVACAVRVMCGVGGVRPLRRAHHRHQSPDRGQCLAARPFGERQGLGGQFGPVAAESAGRVDGDHDRCQVMGADVVQLPGQPVAFGVARPLSALLGPGQPPGRRQPSGEPLASRLAEPGAGHVHDGLDRQLRYEGGPEADPYGGQPPVARGGGGEGGNRDAGRAPDCDGVESEQRSDVAGAVGRQGLDHQRRSERPSQRRDRRAPPPPQRHRLHRHGGCDDDERGGAGQFALPQGVSGQEPGCLPDREQRGQQPVADGLHIGHERRARRAPEEPSPGGSIRCHPALSSDREAGPADGR